MSDLPTLYQLEEDFNALMEMVEENPEMDLADTIEGMEGTLEVKRRQVGYYLQNIAGVARLRREAAAQMLERARALEARHQRLTQYLIASMRKHSILSIECPEWEMKLRQNPERVVIDDEEQVPLEFQEEVTTWKISKKSIKIAINDGKDVPGAHLERGWRLDVK